MKQRSHILGLDDLTPFRDRLDFAMRNPLALRLPAAQSLATALEALPLVALFAQGSLPSRSTREAATQGRSGTRRTRRGRVQVDLELGRHRRRRGRLRPLGLDVAYWGREVDFEIGVQDTDTFASRYGFHNEEAEDYGVVGYLDDVALREGSEVAEGLLEASGALAEVAEEGGYTHTALGSEISRKCTVCACSLTNLPFGSSVPVIRMGSPSFNLRVFIIQYGR